ncbi:hypothetical protein [Rhodococcus opacus]|uniref:hypothetical protein n=1 Tax=Rhodococcus opacus TaxID=37919 RepID=UPI00155B0770|nr:hypothetical protein [Rhodococcus opacus]
MNAYEDATLSAKGNDKIRTLFWHLLHSLTEEQLNEFHDPTMTWVDDEGTQHNPLVPDIQVYDDSAHEITCNGKPLVYVLSETLFDDTTETVQYLPAVEINPMMQALHEIHSAEQITSEDFDD